MTNAVQKILVTGDVDGKIKELFERVASVNKKSGPFDMLLCVGNFFGDDDNDWKRFMDGSFKAPVSTYILGPSNNELVHFYPDNNGSELCSNVTYLGKKGLLTGTDQLKLMYLSGFEGSISDKTHFDADDTKTLRDIIDSDASFKGIDILLTSQWPSGVTKYAPSPEENVDSKGSRLIAHLAAVSRPRYHFCASSHVFYERLPYRNHRVLMESARHATRFISLAKVNNLKKRKWLYAFALTPISSMKESELVKQPMDVTECPYNVEELEKEAIKPTQEKTSQFFFDLNPRKSSEMRKRKNQEGDFKIKKRGPWQPAKPTGPCWFCLGSPEVEKHLVVSIGTDIYLTLPKGGLVADHVLICPIAHFQSTIDLPPEAVQEMENYKKALSKFYASYDKVPVFFERNYRTQHFQIQVVPISKSVEEKIMSAFTQCAEERNFQLKIMPDNSTLDAPPGVPYFHVQLPTGQQLIHIVRKNFPLQFGREVLASEEILDMTDRVDWKKCAGSFEEEKEMATDFKKKFQPFDFTL